MSSSLPRRLLIAFVALGLGLALAWVLFLRPPAAPPPPGATGAPTATAPVPATFSPVRPAATTPDAAADFRAALDGARALAQPGPRAREFGRTLLEWIARDPDAALAYVRQLPPGAEHTQGLLLVLDAIGRTDLDRALTLARELVTTREQRAIYSSLFAQLAAADPASAVARLALVPAGDSRDYALRALADGWNRTDPAAALAWARGLAGADRTAAMEAVLATLGSTDPLRTIELAHETLTGAAFERTLVAALQALTLTDAKAAGALVNTLTPGEAQTQAALAVARALAAQNPSEALVWVRTLPAPDAQRLALNNVLEIWAAQDPVAAGQYVVQMNAGPEQEAAAGHLARLLAANPAGAIAWAQSLTSEPARQTALVNLASAWAQNDPAAAARWATSLASLDVRTPALNGALSYWVMQDSGAARNFVFGLSGETQTAAAAYLAPSLAQQDPVAAIAWTQSLSSAAARDAALIAAYARWLGNAPVAAESWLASANLPAATKARLAGQP
jgi:hypothetical protein